MNIDLRAIPFSLSEKDIRWVKETQDRMKLKDKIRQLFYLIFMRVDAPEYVKELSKAGIKPCGFMVHPEDVPMVKIFINAYTASEEVVEAVVEKLVGKSMVKGINLVDPFYGLGGAKRQ